MTIRNDSIIGDGGGIYNESRSIIVDNCIIRTNTATEDGGYETESLRKGSADSLASSSISMHTSLISMHLTHTLMDNCIQHTIYAFWTPKTLIIPAHP